MRELNKLILVDEGELQFLFFHSSGPGGQNVNKVATAVQLRFDAAHSPSLSEPTRIRLMKLAGKRMTKEGVLVISASRCRTQEANKEDAVKRLESLILQASHPPRKRKATHPSRSAVERRLVKKRQQAYKKRLRHEKNYNEE